MDDKLHDRLLGDLKMMGLPTDFNLIIKDYSKRYEGRYNPNNKQLILYAYNEDLIMLSYSQLLNTAIHEALHHFQWSHDPSFRRIKGVMHNITFRQLERDYKNKAKRLGLLQ